MNKRTKQLIIIISLAVMGCSTTPFEKKQEKIISCVKDLKGNDFEASESFEVCRQVYRFAKVKE